MRKLKVTATVTVKIGEDIFTERMERIGLTFFKGSNGFYDLPDVVKIEDESHEYIETTYARESWLDGGVQIEDKEAISSALIMHDDFLAFNAEKYNISEHELLNLLLDYCDRFHLRILIEAFRLNNLIGMDNSILGITASIRRKVKN